MQQGPRGGATYSYRAARFECGPDGYPCGLFLEERPLHGNTFGAVGTSGPLVDLWVEERRLPSYRRAVKP